MAANDGITIHNKTVSRLARLPEELVSNISLRLGSDDIFNFRQTCKTLEMKSFHEFAIEYFRQKLFIITTESLKVLVAIASSEKLREHLHTIYLIPALFSDRVFNCGQGRSCVWKPSVRQSEAWRGYMTDQQSLKESGGDLKMLTQALKQLPKLDQFTFTDELHHVPRDIDRRGIMKAIRSTNNVPASLPGHPKDKEYYRFKNHVWSILMQALAASGVSTIKHFHAELDQLKNALSVSTNFDLDTKTLAGLKVAFKNAQCLSLNISSRKQSKLEDEDDGIDRVKGGKAMEKFAGALPHLKTLGLTYSYSSSSGALCRSYLSKTNLQTLEKLTLDGTFLSAKYLVTIIGKLNSLQELHLISINLTNGSWPTVLKAIRKLDKLVHLHLTYLAESHERAFFVKPLPEPPLPEDSVNAPGGAHMVDDDNESETEDEDEEYDGDDGSEPFEDFDEEEEYFSGTDDDMPELEPHDGPISTSTSTSISGPALAATSHQPPSVAADLEDSPSDPEDAKAAPSTQPQTAHLPTPPQPAASTPDATETAAKEARDESLTLGSGPERGIKICLNTPALIEKYIPIFIEEYNLDDPMSEAAYDPLNPMNAVINSLGAMIGAGPPPPGLLTIPMPMAVPGGGGGFYLGGGIIPPPPQHQHQHHQHHQHAPHAGAGAAHGGPAAAAAAANAGVYVDVDDMDT